MRITGVGGQVRAGYQLAARVGAWTLERALAGPSPEYTLTAEIVARDAYWAQQAPLAIDLVMGQRMWTWDPMQPAWGSQSLSAIVIGAPTIH